MARRVPADRGGGEMRRGKLQDLPIVLYYPMWCLGIVIALMLALHSGWSAFWPEFRYEWCDLWGKLCRGAKAKWEASK